MKRRNPLVIVRYLCPNCEAPASWRPTAAATWQCPACEHRLHAEPAPAADHLAACAVCGNAELYKKKNFPHALGMAVLVLACVLSVVTYANREFYWTWGILIGSALLDGGLYLLVGDVVVCYRCNAHHRQVKSEPFQPFDLGTAERYRPERIRRQQFEAETQAPP